MIRFLCTLLALISVGIVTGQKNIARQIDALQASGQKPQEATLLQYQSNDIQNRAFQLEGLQEGTVLSLNQEDIQSLDE